MAALHHSAIAIVLAACAHAAIAAPLDRGEVADLFSEAKALFRKANAAAAHDPKAAKELYQGAALRFERIAQEGGIRNGKLFYNLGNTYVRLGDLGRALLAYRRAERLIPDDPNLRQSLDQARRQRADKIGVKEQTQVLKTLFFWHYDVPTVTRFRLFAIAFGLFWACAAIRRLVRKPVLGWSRVLAAVLALLLFGSLLVEELGRHSRAGVVLAEQVVARQGDSETFQPSFEEPLHAGTEFELVEDRGDWLHVELSDGRRCWLPARAVGLAEPPAQPRPGLGVLSLHKSV